VRKQVAYQALQDELEDLRSERLAIERLSGIDTDLTLSLEEINARFK
jgi:antitoxin StbD